MEQRFEQIQEQELRLEMWRDNPFALITGAEVMLNLRVNLSDEEAREFREPVSLETDYKDLRFHLLVHRALSINKMAKNKSGKGQLGMGIWRAFKQDEYFQEQLPKWGIDKVDWVIIPFAHCDRAAKIPKSLYPELGLVDSDKTPATNTPADEAIISALQWALVQETLPRGVTTPKELTEALKDERRAVIWDIEGSTPFVLPKTFGPQVELEGGEDDLGASTIYKGALGIFRRDAYVFAIDPDSRLRDDEDSNEFRVQSLSRQLEADKLYGGLTRVVTTINGQEVDVKDLPPLEQERAHKLLSISMASKEAIYIQHAKKDALNKTLYEKGVIPEPTDRGFYLELRNRLCLAPGHFIIPGNAWFAGEKVYDLAYLQSSYVLKKYPEILGEAA